MRDVQTSVAQSGGGDARRTVRGFAESRHAILAIQAAKAGKDIYCEEPISLTIVEGRAVADTTKQLGTVYQGGMQRRSIASFRFGVDMARGMRSPWRL